jgi:Maltokinase N-terminal cap domain
MATLHSAELRPTKIELLSAWVPTQSWADEVDTASLESVGAFRFDDPDGEVGVETHFLRAADGQILQVPLTYRAQALEGADESLITKMHHSVLGERWVYDASVDPVFARTLATTILLGGEQAELIYVGGESPQKREATTFVRGSGSPTETVPDVEDVTFAHMGNVTVIDTGGLHLRLRRVLNLGTGEVGDNEATLCGRWPGRDEWTLLSTASRTDR